MMVKVGYLNIRGLTQAKHSACVSLIDSGLFDILFLSEHWFVRSFDYMRHPYSFLESKYIPSTNTMGRSQNGILMLVSPRVRNYITSFHSFEYGIYLKVDSLSLLAVYLPPSLPLKRLQVILDQFPSHDLLFGDINCRFTGICQSQRNSSAELQGLWTQHLQKYNLSMPEINQKPLNIDIDALLNSNSEFICTSMDIFIQNQQSTLIPFPCFELDHIFIRHDLLSLSSVNLFHTQQLRFPTDHEYFIHIELPI
jgi:hypothetical protein